MKRVTIILAFVVLALVAVGAFFYRSENVKPTEAELVRYPEMSPFLAGRTGFRGIRFNLDTNYYSFAFPTNFGNAENYFEAVTGNAKGFGWQLVMSEPLRQVYSRKKDAPPGMQQFERVTLIFDPERKEVTLVREDSEGG